jgi:hypothetical protein
LRGGRLFGFAGAGVLILVCLFSHGHYWLRTVGAVIGTCWLLWLLVSVALDSADGGFDA